MRGTITVAALVADGENNNIRKYLKIVPQFISEINNTQIDNAKDIDVVMPVYNLIE